ncbi:hypothetical protein GF361_04280 [Candidatus Woesearchaeota archaeon]|nr:hypothetical protein [Candidatus Woesearchaeota archaeon]
MCILNIFQGLFTNKIFLAIFISLLVAQLIKVHFLVIKQKQKLHFKDIFLTGGMPSSHSSAVTALVIMLFLTEGVTSSSIISLVLAAIIIRDAMGVRRTAGEEGKIINRIIKKSKLKIQKVHYSLGHKPKEVLVGIIIGILTSTIIYFI